MRIEFSGDGIHLPDLDLWLDPRRECRRAWISHAHRDHAGAVHGEVFATAETLEFYRLRHGEALANSALHATPYGQPWELAGARLTAYPAAHVLGAAQLLIEWRGERVLYTGDIKLRAPICGRSTEIVRAHRLIIESTFGLPIFHFLEREEARERMVRFARAALEQGRVPVFLAHELGRGQEIAHVLGQAGVPFQVHPAIARHLPVYAAAGFPAPGWSVHEGEALSGVALILPPRFRSSLSAGSRRVRVAYVSGWAALDNARARTGAEELIPYSDHADFEELMAIVEAVGAQEVDVVHGYTEAFARILTLQGWLARAPERPRLEADNG
jgi:Cft2 family RNA processing exonuclease